jgi:AhpC/TSA family
MAWQNGGVTTSTWLAILSVLIALGAIAGYVSLVGVEIVRNHPEGYVLAFALATAVAVLAVTRAGGRRWPAWVALGLTSLLLIAGAWFNFVGARVPDVPVAIRVGEAAPDFTLPDASGKPVTLAEYRGKKPVVLVFYRGYW